MRIPVPGGIVDTDARVLESPGGDVPLREKEARLFEVLVQAEGGVVSREALNREVFDYAPSVASRTLDATVARLRKKLESIGAEGTVQTVYGEGYRYWQARSEQPRAIVGYDEAEASLRAALAGPGVVLVTGTGGVGKTALVAEVLRDAADVVTVRCSPDRPLAVAVLDAVGMPAAPVDAVGAALALRPGLVLVLDDAEVVDAGDLADALGWTTGTTLRLVVVSRVRLPCPGAREVALSGLDAASARVLFASQAGPVEGDVDGLLARLGHHPLSVVLAARRVRTLGLDAFAKHLARDPDLLSGDDPNPRHRSLARILDATLGLLPEPARAALTALAAVDDPIDDDAAITVIGGGALDGLPALLDAHLVVRHDGEYDLHPRTRAHVRRAGPPAALDAAERRYLAHLAGLVRASLPMAHDLPTDRLARAERRAGVLGDPHASALLYGLCRALHDRGDVQVLEAGLAALPDDDPYAALVAAHLTRQAQPGRVELGDRAIELTRTDPVLAVDAYLQRASVLAHHGRGPEAVRDLDAFEALACGFGEACTVWSWLWTAVVCRVAAPDHAEERMRRIEPHLGRLDGADQLRFYGNAALVAARRLDHRRYLEICEIRTALAEERGDPLELAQAYVQHGPAHWWLGEYEPSVRLMQKAFDLAPAGPRWIQVMSANNLGAMAMHTLDWEASRRALTLGVMRAGTSERSRMTAEIQLGCLEREMGIRGSDAPGPNITGVMDDRWFVWPAQCGDLARSLALAEAVLRDERPVDVNRVRALDAAAELFVAAGHWSAAVEALGIVLGQMRQGTADRNPLVALERVARRALGERVPRWTPPSGLVPYLRVNTEIWNAVEDAFDGKAERALTRIAAVRREVAHPGLTERSVLAWRLRAAEAVVAAVR